MKHTGPSRHRCARGGYRTVGNWGWYSPSARHLQGWCPDRSRRERSVPAGVATADAVQQLHHSCAHPGDWRRGEFAHRRGVGLHRSRSGILASMVAGLIMVGYIVGEVVMLRQVISWTPGLYFGLGLAIAGLATSLWMAGHRRHHLQIKHT